MATPEAILSILANQAVGTVPPPTTTAILTATTTSGPNPPVASIPTALRNLRSLQNVFYPHEVPKFYIHMEVFNYSRQTLLRLGTLVSIGNIILPLPMNLFDSHNVSYDEKPLGPVVGGLGGNLTGRIGRTDNIINSSQSLRRQIGALGIAAAGGATSVLGGVASTFLDPGRAFLGLTPNRFLTILLEGPKYKRFEFTWRLSPKTEKESESLRILKKNLNNYMSPGLTLGGSVFTFPKIFQITIMPNPKYMYKFKPAVIETFTCNYTPGQQPAFYKARPGTSNLPAPEGVDMSLRFIELEYWLEGDFNDNNDNNPTFPTIPPTVLPSPPTNFFDNPFPRG